MYKRLLWATASLALVSAPLLAQLPSSRVTTTEFVPLEDLALTSLVRQTLELHPQVLAAEAALEGGEALALAAERPLFNPELELGFESADTNDRVLRFTQTLDIAGQREARTRVASRQLDARQQLLAISRRDVAVELLSALAKYWTASELAALAQRRAELMQRFADVAMQRSRAGDLTRADLNLASLARSEARMERATAAGDLAAAEQALRALVPRERVRSWPRLPVALPDIQVTEQEISQLVAAMPEARFREQAIAAAAAEVTLRERERRASPSLSVIGGEEEGETLIGLGFSIPLNVRHRFVHEVQAARASQRQAEREAENVTVRAVAAAQAATERYGLVREAWTAWASNGATDLTEQTELLERLWRAGELSLTDYLVQLNQTLDTGRSAHELRRQLWMAWFEWLAATGQTGEWLDVPIEAISATR